MTSNWSSEDELGKQDLNTTPYRVEKLTSKQYSRFNSAKIAKTNGKAGTYANSEPSAATTKPRAKHRPPPPASSAGAATKKLNGKVAEEDDVVMVVAASSDDEEQQQQQQQGEKKAGNENEDQDGNEDENEGHASRSNSVIFIPGPTKTATTTATKRAAPASANVVRKGRRAPSRELEATNASKNGLTAAARTTGRGKGKAKLTMQQPKDTVEVKAVDEIDLSAAPANVREEDEGEGEGDDDMQVASPSRSAKGTGRSVAQAGGVGGTSRDSEKLIEMLRKEIEAGKRREERQQQRREHATKQAQEAQKQRDDLARQMDELLHIRTTEPEERLEQQKRLYENRLQTQEEMIQELTTQLARVDTLTREGKTSTLHFLTREAADEERRGIERQLETHKETIQENKQIIEERDAAIRELQEEVKTLKVELNAEVERCKFLSLRPNGRVHAQHSEPPSKRPGAPDHSGTKRDLTLQLYEDLTNILITDCKSEYVIADVEVADSKGEEQRVFSCVYTHLTSKQSLAFTLRLYSEPDENGQESAKVAYTPQQLSNESEDALEKLDFLTDSFTFQRSQLDVFLEKIYDAMNAAFGTNED